MMQPTGPHTRGQHVARRGTALWMGSGLGRQALCLKGRRVEGSVRRFRRERRSGRLRKWGILRTPRTPRTVDLWGWGGNREIEYQWKALQESGSDRASRNRLAHLIDRLTGFDRGARESALAEIELAILLFRSGCTVKFLPESPARTADLEFHLGQDRFFV